MTDDFRRDLRDAFGVDGDAPLDEIVTRGRRLHQRRRGAAVGGDHLESGVQQLQRVAGPDLCQLLDWVRCHSPESGNALSN